MTLTKTFGAFRRPARAALAALALGVLGACDLDETLTVEDPDVATPESVQSVSALPTVRAGALGDFALALTGSGDSEDGMIQYTGLLGDELVWAETFPTRGVIDTRNMVPINSTLEEMFYRIQRARAAAERAADAYTRLAPDAAERSEMYSIAGMSYVLIGEAYCSGVPFSNLVSGAQQFGEPRTTTQIFERAVQLFDSALAVAPASGEIRYLAQVGKGRALLNLERYADAAAAVAGVPTSFSYELEYSENTSRQNNGVYVVTHLNDRFSVIGDDAGTAPNGGEGGEGLPYLTDDDPRVEVELADDDPLGFDGETNLYLQQKYDDRETPVVVASGIEARLIEAEAQLQTAPVTALATLNALRANSAATGVTGLAPLAPAVGTEAQVRQLFKERAYWMFLTAHRLGDMRRLIRQYGLSEDSVFPSGTYQKEGEYGDDVNFPIPFSERNNPRYLEASLDARGCLDSGA
jgi:starch-binding outer membrane protein, SusD/RagB family